MVIIKLSHPIFGSDCDCLPGRNVSRVFPVPFWLASYKLKYISLSGSGYCFRFPICSDFRLVPCKRDHTFLARFWKRANKVSGCFLGPFFSGQQGSGIPSWPVFIIIVITRKYELVLDFNQNFRNACDITYRMVFFFKFLLNFIDYYFNRRFR